MAALVIARVSCRLTLNLLLQAGHFLIPFLETVWQSERTQTLDSVIPFHVVAIAQVTSPHQHAIRPLCQCL
jgi:hypothetical protein